MMKRFAKKKALVPQNNTNGKPTNVRQSVDSCIEQPDKPQRVGRAQAVLGHIRAFITSFLCACHRVSDAIQKTPVSASHVECRVHNDRAETSQCAHQSSRTQAIVKMTLEDFQFHGILGQGSYGKVLLSTHILTNRPLAIKMISKKKSHLKEALLEREVMQALASSPFCTHAYGAFQAKNYVFFVMEYLSGGSLLDIIIKKESLDIPTTRFITAELICGLNFIHSKGIVHRDIKPDNILLDSAGHVRIADFGLSASNAFRPRSLAIFCGTPPYMAPEIYRRQPYGYAVDYFALGCTVYLMATGALPFNPYLHIVQLKAAICKKSPSFPRKIDEHLQDLIEKLLCKCPKTREEHIQNLRTHLFFQTIDWTATEAGKAIPPFSLKCPALDLSNKMELQELSYRLVKKSRFKRNQKMYNAFSFVCSNWGEILQPEDAFVIENPCKSSPAEDLSVIPAALDYPVRHHSAQS